ncbi:MAG: AIR synthase related protein, partial [Dethiobacteria bacterium]|nr:AIR synthase related protein [Dethiobacteria bacterium]
LIKLLGSTDLASKEWVWRRYDYMVRTSTLQGPGGDAAIIRLRESGKALALTVDGNGRHTYLDPHLGGKLAVAEALRNLSCTGAEPIGITDCLNFGNPEKPEIFWQFRQAVEGMAEACRVLETPVVGGNVSFYNEVEGEAIYPTPVVGAVGLLESDEKPCGMAFLDAGNLILMLGAPDISLGGSQFLKSIHRKVAGRLAAIDLEFEKRLQDLLRRLIREKLISSAHDLSDGGLAVALAESCLGGSKGASVTLPMTTNPALSLFGEGPSRAIVSLKQESLEQVRQFAAEAAVPLFEIGSVGGDALKIALDDDLVVNLGLTEMRRTHEEVFSCIMD